MPCLSNSLTAYAMYIKFYGIRQARVNGAARNNAPGCISRQITNFSRNRALRSNKITPEIKTFFGEIFSAGRAWTCKGYTIYLFLSMHNFVRAASWLFIEIKFFFFYLTSVMSISPLFANTLFLAAFIFNRRDKLVYSAILVRLKNALRDISFEIYADRCVYFALLTARRNKIKWLR